jgi:predicted transcriptional regulator
VVIAIVRKLRLSPLQSELLRLLSEAGEENLACIRSTLKPRDQEEFSRQVTGLRRLGLVVDSVEPSNQLPSLVLTAVGREALRS